MCEPLLCRTLNLVRNSNTRTAGKLIRTKFSCRYRMYQNQRKNPKKKKKNKEEQKRHTLWDILRTSRMSKRFHLRTLGNRNTRRSPNSPGSDSHRCK